MISADDLSSLEETPDIVSRSALFGEIRSSLDEFESGEAEVLSKDDALARLLAR